VSGMNVKTFRIRVWSVLVVGTLATGGWASEPGGSGYEVKISVFNDAQISERTLLRAERVAAELFAHAGIRTDWMNCGPAAERTEEQALCNEAAFPLHLQLRIRERSLNLGESTLGLSFLDTNGIGGHADVFFAGIGPIEQEAHLRTETVLGLVMAHEVGHLLLGSKSHSASGIMRAHWQRQELSAAGEGALGFSEAEARKMQNRLESASSVRESIGMGHSGSDRRNTTARECVYTEAWDGCAREGQSRAWPLEYPRSVYASSGVVPGESTAWWRFGCSACGRRTERGRLKEA